MGSRSSELVCRPNRHVAEPFRLLQQPNHLLSAPPLFLKLFFHNTADLQLVRRELLPVAQTNSAKFTAVDAYADVIGAEANGGGEEGGEKAWGAEDGERKKREREPGECVIDVREHDIAYYLRVAIDLGKHLIFQNRYLS